MTFFEKNGATPIVVFWFVFGLNRISPNMMFVNIPSNKPIPTFLFIIFFNIRLLFFFIFPPLPFYFLYPYFIELSPYCRTQYLFLINYRCFLILFIVSIVIFTIFKNLNFFLQTQIRYQRYLSFLYSILSLNSNLKYLNYSLSALFFFLHFLLKSLHLV